jgi:hypothetical protein
MKTFVVVICFSIFLRSVGQASEAEDRKLFEKCYAVWKTWVEGHLYMSDLSMSKEFGDIVMLGPSVIPFIVEKIETNPDDYDFSLVRVISRLTSYRFGPGDWPDSEPGDERFDSNKRRVLTYVRWWKEGRFKTRERFVEWDAERRRLKAEGRVGEAGSVFWRIIDLGIPVLPYLIEHVEKEPEFVKGIARLTIRWDGGLPTNATPSECKTWWEQNKARYELPPLRESGSGSQPAPSPTSALPVSASSTAAPVSRVPYAVPLAAGAGCLAALFLWRGIRRKKP